MILIPDCMNTPVQLQATGADTLFMVYHPTYLSCTSCTNPVSTPLDNIEYYVQGNYNLWL